MVSLTYPDCFFRFSFSFVPPQRKTEKSCLAMQDYLAVCIITLNLVHIAKNPHLKRQQIKLIQRTIESVSYSSVSFNNSSSTIASTYTCKFE